jgi:hypothetical protein
LDGFTPIPLAGKKLWEQFRNLLKGFADTPHTNSQPAAALFTIGQNRRLTSSPQDIGHNLTVKSRTAEEIKTQL